MRRVLLSACAGFLAAAMASTSFAADMPVKAPYYKAPVYVGPAFTWTGIYVGINGGYGWGNADFSNTLGSTSFNTHGGLVGATLGYNAEWKGLLWGLEGDFDASWLKGSDSTAGTICAVGCEAKTPWLATTRMRFGTTYERWLTYVTGGAAFGEVEVGLTSGATETAIRVGWTVGGGIEYAFAGGWSFKTEYLYVDLGTTSCGVPTCALSTDVKTKSNIVRAGLNYRF